MVRLARGPGAAGFSLPELLIATAISSAVLGTIAVVTSQVQRSANWQLDSASVQQEAHQALDGITRLLREAGANPYTVIGGACPVAGTLFRAIQRDPNANGRDDDIRIHADVNPPNGLLGGIGGGSCGETGEDVTIAHDPANLTIVRQDHNQDVGPVPMTDRVITSLRFTYLDTNRDVTASDISTAFVRVAVMAETPIPDPHTRLPRKFTLNAEVRLRAR